MRVVYWLVVAVAASVCAAFAISNRLSVSLALWPLPFAINLPLYLLVFAALAAGFAIGALAVWIAGRHRRREFRRRRRRIAALEAELATMRAERGAAGIPPPPLPARDQPEIAAGLPDTAPRAGQRS